MVALGAAVLVIAYALWPSEQVLHVPRLRMVSRHAAVEDCGGSEDHLSSVGTCFRRRLHITRQLQQATSNTCGLYCIFFVHYCQTHSFVSFLSKFSHDYTTNDLLVNLYAKQYTL